MVPPSQSPDEVQHFVYVQSLAESFELPGHRDSWVSRAATRSPTTPSEQAGKPSIRNHPRLTGAAETGTHISLRSEPTVPEGLMEMVRTPLAATHRCTTSTPGIGYRAAEGRRSFGQLYAVRISGVLLL